MDGLASEREQGITIDVSYRYFSTDKRKFIIAVGCLWRIAEAGVHRGGAESEQVYSGELSGVGV